MPTTDNEPGNEPVEECVDVDFTDAVFADEEWVGRSFVGCRFTDADLRGLRTRGCRFTDCDFTRADLGASQHRATAFHTCTFQRTMLAGSVLERCSLLGSTISECRLRPWTLREVDLRLTALGHADLRETVLSGLKLTEANLGSLGTVPAAPAANTELKVAIGAVNVATIILNEQTKNPDGSLTVNAVHVKLAGDALGALGSGDVIVSSATCGPAAPPVPLASGAGLWLGLGLLGAAGIPAGFWLIRRRTAKA